MNACQLKSTLILLENILEIDMQKLNLMRENLINQDLPLFAIELFVYTF